MTNRHTSHVASGLADGHGAPAQYPANAAPPRRSHGLGGVLRWDADRAGGLRLFRRMVALPMALVFAHLPVMQTVAAAERTGAAAAQTTRVAALSPARLPLEVAAPAFTLV